MDKQVAVKWGQPLLSVLIIAGLVAYLWKHKEAFTDTLSLPYDQLAAMACLVVLNWAANSLPMLIFTRLAGKRIGFWANFFVMAAAMLGNYLPMRLGTIVRMRFFKKSIGMDYSSFVGIMMVRTLLLAITSSLFCGLGFIGLRLQGYTLPLAVYGLFGALFVGALAALFLPVSRISIPNRFIQGRLEKLTEAHRTMRKQPKAMLAVMCCILFQQLCFSLRLYISFAAFGVIAPLWLYIIVGPASSLLTFVTVTPGNLGLREWVIGALTSATGFDFQAGFFASTLDRGVMLALTFILGGIGIIYTIRKSSAAYGSSQNDENFVDK
ncbi:lysylphosphatidylglycerol synthase transmembrane domain-containing protein [Desulfovibrio sp. Fe33]|uniref:lysylphosphatidylglycerol synthase transmembrane domain-containing protein n=1 Tax=Desulfovibrio sp. Fe33 TaxID=3020842 RepID=UPI00234C54A1|nr:lysylphosphatidylglycerol synthase transmembrane domain-containing protein [Desulfovibrio sp. Fe33]